MKNIKIIRTAKRIAALARKSLSKFCREECKSYCCRKGYLVLNQKELGLVSQCKKNELINQGRLKKTNDGRYSLFIGDSNQPCPSLSGLKCLVYGHKHRPKCCREYPLFIEGNTLRLASRCPAVSLGMLYPYAKRIQMLGYEIIYPVEKPNLDALTCSLVF